MTAATHKSCDANDVEKLTHYDHASFEALAQTGLGAFQETNPLLQFEYILLCRVKAAV
jgi:hypothetical protein